MVLRSLPTLGLIIALVLALTSAGTANSRTAASTGPIVRPIAWAGQQCSLEAFTPLLFTADDSVASVVFEALVDGGDNPSCADPIRYTWDIGSVYVLPRDVYEAHLVEVEGSDLDCLVFGESYLVPDLAAVPSEAFVLRDTSGFVLDYQGQEWESLEISLPPLQVGQEYAVTMVHDLYSSCEENTQATLNMSVVTAGSDILRVAADGSGDFTSIAAALEVALPNVTVQVDQGTYLESRLTLPPGVILTKAPDATGPAAVGSLDGGPIFALTDLPDTVRISGLTFTAADSSAIQIEYCDAVLTGCRFVDNSSHRGGGAIRAVDNAGHRLKLLECVFEGNESIRDGGAVEAGGELEMIGCSLVDNYSGYFGGGLGFHGEILVVKENRFQANRAQWFGGAASSVTSQYLYFQDCEMVDNLATNASGGFFSSDEPKYIYDCIFRGNQDLGGGSGVVFVTGTSAGTWVRNCAFVGNIGVTGIFKVHTATLFYGCTFADNLVQGHVITGVPDASWFSLTECLLAFNGGPVASPEFSGDLLQYYVGATNIYGNTGGDWVGPLVNAAGRPGNFSADPLFCSLESGSFSLRADSPCLAANTTSGYLIGAGGLGCATENPVIVGADDVPADQGGALQLSWLKSLNDEGELPAVASYALELRVQDSGNWQPLATVSALGDSVYTAVVPTGCDSSASWGNCWTTYRVIARDGSGTALFSSAPDSGYSVDNLVPSAPLDLAAQVQGNQVVLNWSPAGDPDIARYDIYRQLAPDCAAVASEPLATVTTTTWIDLEPEEPAANCYLVVARDHADNQGPPATISLAVADVPLEPGVATLRAPYPNPFNPRTKVSFFLPRAGNMELGVYDLRGRLVRRLVGGQRPAGWQTVIWEGRDEGGSAVASGVYLVALRAEGKMMTRRLVLLK